MDTAKIESALSKLFHEDGQRIVFWNDPDHEFDMLLPALRLDGVKLLRLDQIGAFEAKLKLEREVAALARILAGSLGRETIQSLFKEN